MAAPSESAPNAWEDFIRKMLPEGAPLPDEDQLDFSISVDYTGPSPFFKPPINNPTIPKTRFTTFPKQPPSFTPTNSSWFKSNSGSLTTESDNKRLSTTSSIAFATDLNCSDAGVKLDPAAVVSDRYDPDYGNLSRFHEMKLETNRDDYAFRVRVRVRVRRCVRCGKGGNEVLSVRERCIVCGAEYCKKCVMKAMGAMPEGRKCVGCIGMAIDEANRGKLGKGSRLLSKICSRLEVRRIMQVEKECMANQVKPEQVILNGRELRKAELDELLGCAVPPRGLKPGRYWYDKDSGFWGKEGKKPVRIISSKLDVGGKLKIDASKGDTRVYMNGREITKVELRVLKLAKVQCPRDTHFWLYEDGSYEEEGQNKIKGNIWEKASIRFICSLLSLAVPRKPGNCARKDRASISSRLFPEYLEQHHRVQKLLLIGLEGSETSTIFKQAKLIYTKTFTHEELQKIKLIIQTKMYGYLSTLLAATEHFEEEAFIKLQSTVLAGQRSVTDWLLATGDFLDTTFPAAALEYAPLIDKIWKDPAVQETYKRIRRDELPFVPHVAKYFLDRALEISSDEYEPSENDILFAEGITPSNGLACTDFSFDDQSAVSQIYNQQPLSTTYQIILLSSPRLNNGCKWLEMFEGTNVVIFCISLNDYNQLWTHSTGFQQNKMVANKELFETIARKPCFENTPFLILLTNYEAFEEQINETPLTVCEWFSDFKPLKTHGKSSSVASQAFHYIAVKFKGVYNSFTRRKLHVHRMINHERKTVDEAFRYTREILDWDEHKDDGFFAVSDEDSVSAV